MSYSRKSTTFAQPTVLIVKDRLSISKWIHLNGEDRGLMHFFGRVHSVLRVGGFFVLEPQEWESYHKARRMNPVSVVPSVAGA